MEIDIGGNYGIRMLFILEYAGFLIPRMEAITLLRLLTVIASGCLSFAILSMFTEMSSMRNLSYVGVPAVFMTDSMNPSPLPASRITGKCPSR